MRIGRRMFRFVGVISILLLVLGCQTDSRQQLLLTGKSQVELRSFQSRTFDTSNKERTLRTVIATLQDLSFVVDKADATLGSVTATKLDQTMASMPYQLRMTVTVRPKGGAQMIVRANATYNITPVEDPEPYQQFFTALSKSMFLEANTTAGADYPGPPSSSRTAAASPSRPVPQFASSEARSAWFNEAKQDLVQKYERLITSERKQRYNLGCDKSTKLARTQACQDVSFQIQLLEEAKEKELATLDGQYRRAAARKSIPQQALSQSPPKVCDPGSEVDFARDRKAIKDVLSYALDTSECINCRFYEFKNLETVKSDCGQITLAVTYAMEDVYHTEINQRIREISLIKKDNKIFVDHMGEPLKK